MILQLVLKTQTVYKRCPHMASSVCDNNDDNGIELRNRYNWDSRLEQ